MHRNSNSRFYQLGHTNFSSVMSLFSKKPKPAANPNDPNLEPKLGADGKPLPGQDIDPATGKLKAPGARPNDPNNMDDPTKSKDPLAIFDGMWDTKAKNGETNTPPSFALDPEAVKKITEQLSFSPQMTPELLEKFKSGDPETISSILNATGRQAYSMLMQHIPALTDKYVSARLDHDRAGLGRSVRQSLTANSLETLASKNPVLRQQLDRVVEAIYDKYPDATPDWVADQAKSYFTGIASLLNPDADGDTGDTNDPAKRKKSQVQDTDWLEYLSREHKKQP